MTTFRNVLVLGGARSGKSRHAQALAERFDGTLTFIATAQAFDHEMTERIVRHRADRDGRWRTIEAPLDLPRAVADADGAGAILVDCLTLWTSNLMLAGADPSAAAAALLASIDGLRSPLIVVANEVGLGIVPDNALARRFRDAAGTLNQQVAAHVTDVHFVAAGLPLILKRDGHGAMHWSADGSQAARR